MNELKYIQEPGTITRDSLMNFEIGAIVEYLDSKHSVIDIDGKIITIEHLETKLKDRTKYTDLHVLILPKMKPEPILVEKEPEPLLEDPEVKKSRQKWTTKELNFLCQNFNLPNSNLSRLLGRTEASISTQKSNLKPTLKF